jgi:transcription initiation factor TFIID subunit TAF12
LSAAFVALSVQSACPAIVFSFISVGTGAEQHQALCSTVQSTQHLLHSNALHTSQQQQQPQQQRQQQQQQPPQQQQPTFSYSSSRTTRLSLGLRPASSSSSMAHSHQIYSHYCKLAEHAG